MKIITVSREFGSGGRELGKRMADILGFDYYDREIITKVAQSNELDSDYVARILDNHEWRTTPFTFRASFASEAYQNVHTELLVSEKQVIEGIAALGHDCIIVGRNADVYLEKYHPLNLFVCADMASKIVRCQERAGAGEKLTDKEMEKKIRRIDKNRAFVHDVVSDTSWGKSTSYHLTVNTTGWQIKELAPLVSSYAEKFFEIKK